MNPSEIARSLEAGVADSASAEVIEVTPNDTCLLCGIPSHSVLCPGCMERARLASERQEAESASAFEYISQGEVDAVSRERRARAFVALECIPEVSPQVLAAGRLMGAAMANWDPSKPRAASPWDDITPAWWSLGFYCPCGEWLQLTRTTPSVLCDCGRGFDAKQTPTVEVTALP